MNFEEHLRNWSGYENAQIYLDPTTAKLVAEVLAAARDRVGAEYDTLNQLEYALHELDTHYAKEHK